MNFKRVLTPSINWMFAANEKTKRSNNIKNHQLYVHIYHNSEHKNLAVIAKAIQAEFDLKCELSEIIQRHEMISILKDESHQHWICFTDSNPRNKWDHYIWGRDFCGSLWNELKSKKHDSIIIDIRQRKKLPIEFSNSVATGLIVGLENASYAFLPTLKDEVSKWDTAVYLKVPNHVSNQAMNEAISIKLARHLVNLPPNLLNPQSFVDLIKKNLNFSKRSQVTVWDAQKCKQERMNLLLAVGAGSESLSKLVHIKYRPAQKSSKKPIAFVGKGITFDTGGLDIKPSSGMRLMKKDMGGSASVLALAYFVDQAALSQPCDFYLALAENSVDSRSMRPSDVYQSRAGYWVEIDNTDAEGRLVLADAMNVALTQKETPSHLIDVATLTGAIKVGLGADIAGLFTNDDQLANELHIAGELSGEPNWRMPLYQKYQSQLNSSFADFRNSADGFGGAITAALFLEKFASIGSGKEKISPKWAHLDVYCWNDKPHGALQTVGGSGQPVQTLVRWLKKQK